MLFSTLLILEFSFVTTAIIIKGNNAHKRRQSYDDWDVLTKDILRYMKSQQTKAWWPTWTVTPIYNNDAHALSQANTSRSRQSSALRQQSIHQGPFSEVDSEEEDYKQLLNPTYIKKHRGSMETNVVLFTKSTIIVNGTDKPVLPPGSSFGPGSGPTTEKTTTTTTKKAGPTTKSPLAIELNAYIKENDVGLFSAVLVKFLKIISTKNLEELKPLLHQLDKHVEKLLDSGHLGRLPDPNIVLRLNEFLQEMDMLLKFSSPQEIQHKAALAILIIEDELKIHPERDTRIYKYLDTFYESYEAPHMLKAIEDFNAYPRNGMTAKQVVGELVKMLTLPVTQVVARSDLNDLNLRAHTYVNFNVEYIDRNEAKMITNQWNYNMDSPHGIFGKIKSNQGATIINEQEKIPVTKDSLKNEDGSTSTVKVKVNNKEIFKSRRMQNRNNIIKNNNDIIQNLKHKFIQNWNRSDGVLKRTGSKHVGYEETNITISEDFNDSDEGGISNKQNILNSKKIKLNSIKNNKNELRTNIVNTTIYDLEQQNCKNNLKEKKKYKVKQPYSRLSSYSHESTSKEIFVIKTDNVDTSRFAFETAKDTTPIKIIQTQTQSSDFKQTRNIIRKRYKHSTTNHSLKIVYDLEQRKNKNNLKRKKQNRDKKSYSSKLSSYSQESTQNEIFPSKTDKINTSTLYKTAKDLIKNVQNIKDNKLKKINDIGVISIQDRLFRAVEENNNRQLLPKPINIYFSSSSDTDEEIELKNNLNKALRIHKELNKGKN